VDQDDILDCLDKQLTVRGLLRRKAKTNKQRISNDEIPFLWILTPTASEAVLNAFASHLTPEWGEGIYLLPEQQEKEQTLQQGRQEEASNLVIKLLQRRFGEIPQNIEETIEGLSVERLEELAVALLDFEGMTALVSWLEESASN
jgi:hypothetical protein